MTFAEEMRAGPAGGRAEGSGSDSGRNGRQGQSSAWPGSCRAAASARIPYLKLLAVGEGRTRSKGVGAALLQSGPSKHGDLVLLLVSDFNRRAQRFYAAPGYTGAGAPFSRSGAPGRHRDHVVQAGMRGARRSRCLPTLPSPASGGGISNPPCPPSQTEEESFATAPSRRPTGSSDRRIPGSCAIASTLSALTLSGTWGEVLQTLGDLGAAPPVARPPTSTRRLGATWKPIERLLLGPQRLTQLGAADTGHREELDRKLQGALGIVGAIPQLLGGGGRQARCTHRPRGIEPSARRAQAI